MPLDPDVPRTPTDPEGQRPYGHQILALTDRLNGAETYREAAEATEHVLDEADGVLARLGQLFEAAAEQAKTSDEGWELAYRFEDAAATLTQLSDELHDASDEMRALDPPPQAHWHTQIARYYATAPHRPPCPTPQRRHTRAAARGTSPRRAPPSITPPPPLGAHP